LRGLSLAADAFPGPLPALEIQPDRFDGVVIVRLLGELDPAAEEAFTEAMERLRNDTPMVILDLRQVKFIDSCGLRLLLAERQNLGEIGRTLVVYVDDGSPVQRLLGILCLDGAVVRATPNGPTTEQDAPAP
jgi:anti-anti-sigma factor